MTTLAVVGHVEHITMGRAPGLPALGGIAHLDAPTVMAGGGGGVTFFQLAKSSAELHLFTAFGSDETGREMEARVRATGAHIHGGRREQDHTRDLVVLTPEGERTIFVIGEPLHAKHSDNLPWDTFKRCDAVFFTGQDAEVLKLARQAPLLVVQARRRAVLIQSEVRADVVVGSKYDPREASTLADYPVRPRSLVMTEGAQGGRIDSSVEGSARFAAPAAPSPIVSSYGAGDSFAGALTYFLATGVPIAEACRRAGDYGAAVLSSSDTLAAQKALP